MNLAAISTPPARAQDPVEANVRRELEKLDQLLATAREVVAAYDNREARAHLHEAETLRQAAESKIKRGALILALADIKQATFHAEQAIRLALAGPLTRLRNHWEELLRRAEVTVVGSGHREAERLLQRARRSQTDAEAAFRLHGYAKAVQLYQNAISFLEQALKLVEGPRAVPVPNVEREKERFHNLKERAREAMDTSKNPAALRVYQQALKQGEAAEQAFRRGDVATAQQLLHGAIRLLLRAIDLALAGQKGPQAMRHEVALLQDLIQSAEQDTKESPDPRAAILLERSRLLVREAEMAIERQQAQEVRWRLELARNFIDRAIRRADRSGEGLPSFEQRCEEALRELAQDLAEVGAKARETDKAEALQFVELATRAQMAAENACRLGRQANRFRHYQFAFQFIRAAHYFLLRAETMLRESATANQPAREAVQQRLAQLDATLGEIRQDPSRADSELGEGLLQQVTELRERARAALERGHLNVASETIAVAFDLIRESIKINTLNQNQPR
jgi:hypothetical protein